MGIYIILFAIVVGVFSLLKGINKLKLHQRRIAGYGLIVIGIGFLIFTCYDVGIILHALFS